MFKIVNEKKSTEINLDDVNFSSSYNIICYVTSGGLGVGILISNPSKRESGFVYHSDMVRNKFNDLKFKGCTPEKAVQNVIKEDRIVLMFSDYEEFLTFLQDYKSY